MENTIVNETLAGLMESINYKGTIPRALENMTGLDSKYLKDLKINTGNALKYDTLSPKESALLALSVAINGKIKALEEAFTAKAREAGATEEELSETYACVSLLNVNNVFYRFRHFTKKEFYTATPAGIKMGIMANPVLGKEFFELMSLGVSALNGCELCVTSHEESLVKLGCEPRRIYDAVRLVSIIKGLGIFF
jgi:alkyl hydroperoxide reductase subunit D